jgi:Bacterial regulatory proteins, tetR family
MSCFAASTRGGGLNAAAVDCHVPAWWGGGPGHWAGREGFDRLTVDAGVRRGGAGKATLYRRWSSKTALVVTEAAALFAAPEVPDTGDLGEDLRPAGGATCSAKTRIARSSLP